jgi:chromosome segregation ATPase
MDNLPAAEPRVQVDHSLLDAVEREIQRALERASALEADMDEFTAQSNPSWENAFDGITSSLSGWEKHLGDLSRHTAAIEAELQQRESALREWFQIMGATNDELSKISANRRR